VKNVKYSEVKPLPPGRNAVALNEYIISRILQPSSESWLSKPRFTAKNSTLCPHTVSCVSRNKQRLFPYAAL